MQVRLQRAGWRRPSCRGAMRIRRSIRIADEAFCKAMSEFDDSEIFSVSIDFRSHNIPVISTTITYNSTEQVDQSRYTKLSRRLKTFVNWVSNQLSYAGMESLLTRPFWDIIFSFQSRSTSPRSHCAETNRPIK